MTTGFRIGLIAVVLASTALSGCASQGTVGGASSAEASSTKSASPASHHPASPLTGSQLSALVTAPDAFTLKTDSSSDSGTVSVTPTPNPVDPTTITCSDWWSGHGYFGPGTLGYTRRLFTRTDQTSLSVTASIYPAGKTSGMVDASVAIQNRCTHFTYVDSNSAQYLVDVHPGPQLAEGDRAWTYDATETAGDGTVFPTQVCYIQVGDVFLFITETGPAHSSPDRKALPIHQWVTGLIAAGY